MPMGHNTLLNHFGTCVVIQMGRVKGGWKMDVCLEYTLTAHSKKVFSSPNEGDMIELTQGHLSYYRSRCQQSSLNHICDGIQLV